MKLTEVNIAFMKHREQCSPCCSSGPGLCRVGMELMRLFHAVLVAEIAKETRESGELKRERVVA